VKGEKSNDFEKGAEGRKTRPNTINSAFFHSKIGKFDKAIILTSQIFKKNKKFRLKNN
jgi:hypothetical protein